MNHFLYWKYYYFKYLVILFTVLGFHLFMLNKDHFSFGYINWPNITGYEHIGPMDLKVEIRSDFFWFFGLLCRGGITMRRHNGGIQVVRNNKEAPDRIERHSSLFSFKKKNRVNEQIWRESHEPVFNDLSPHRMATMPDPSLERCSSCFFPTEFHDAPLVAVKEYNHDTKIFTFGLPAGVSLDLPVCACILVKGANQDGEPAIRPYTPTSSNEQKGSFDLMVKVSTRLFLCPFVRVRLQACVWTYLRQLIRIALSVWLCMSGATSPTVPPSLFQCIHTCIGVLSLAFFLCLSLSLMLFLSLSNTHAYTHTQTHTQAHIYTHMHTRFHAHTRKPTLTRSHTHILHT